MGYLGIKLLCLKLKEKINNKKIPENRKLVSPSKLWEKMGKSCELKEKILQHFNDISKIKEVAF